MSKADQLGAGRFGAGDSAISPRRAAIGAATGVPTQGVAAPTKLPVQRISLNPDNPRTSLGDLSGLAGSLKEHGQKQAITVMNRDAYVAVNPARESELEPHTTHVVVDGSSRLAAAREAGLTHLKVMVDDDQGADGDAILESALVANIHRQDLAELDEAHALNRLLAIHGTQTALAARLHKSQGWVSQRLALLNLTPELQERIGHEPIKMLRAVGNQPADQQEAALDELKKRNAKKAAKNSKGEVAAKSGPVEAAPQPTNDDETNDGATEEPTTQSGAPGPQTNGTSDEEAPAWLMPDEAVRHFSDLFIEQAKATGSTPEKAMWEMFHAVRTARPTEPPHAS